MQEASLQLIMSAMQGTSQADGTEDQEDDSGTTKPGHKTRKPYTITKQRERWSDQEHERFVEALRLHGRQWRKIEGLVKTKTAVQIRSHAQKFFSKLEKQQKQLQAGLQPSISGVPVDLAVPPPRPKRKCSKPYPRKMGEFSDIVNQAGQLSLQALPDYAALVHGGGEVTDVTVAAVTAAASAAAAAAAAAVVAAAGKEIETKLQACPPSVFPFYGLTPAMLRAMSNPATMQANIQATINATSRQQHLQEQQLGGATAQQIGVERMGTSQPGFQPQPSQVHGEDGEDSACSRENAGGGCNDIGEEGEDEEDEDDSDTDGPLDTVFNRQLQGSTSHPNLLAGLVGMYPGWLAQGSAAAAAAAVAGGGNAAVPAALAQQLWGHFGMGAGGGDAGHAAGQYIDPALVAAAQLWGIGSVLGSLALGGGTAGGSSSGAAAAGAAVHSRPAGSPSLAVLPPAREQQADVRQAAATAAASSLPPGATVPRRSMQPARKVLEHGSKTTHGSGGSGGDGSSGEDQPAPPHGSGHQQQQPGGQLPDAGRVQFNDTAEGEGSGSNPTGNGSGAGGNGNGSGGNGSGSGLGCGSSMNGSVHPHGHWHTHGHTNGHGNGNGVSSRLHLLPAPLPPAGALASGTNGRHGQSGRGGNEKDGGGGGSGGNCGSGNSSQPAAGAFCSRPPLPSSRCGSGGNTGSGGNNGSGSGGNGSGNGSGENNGGGGSGTGGNGSGGNGHSATAAAGLAAAGADAQAANASGDDGCNSNGKQAMSRLTEQPPEQQHAEQQEAAQQPQQAAGAAGAAGQQVPAPPTATRRPPALPPKQQPSDAAALGATGAEQQQLPVQQQQQAMEQQEGHTQAIQAAMQALHAAGLHQLIMQQTYAQLPPGMQAPFGQQLGLSASWLGHATAATAAAAPAAAAAAAPAGATAAVGLGSARTGFEPLSGMQQQMSMQLAAGLPSWAAPLLQPPAAQAAGLRPPLLDASHSRSLDVLPPAATTRRGAADVPPAVASAPDLTRVQLTAQPAHISAGSGPSGITGQKRTHSPRPAGGSRKRPHPSRSQPL